MGKSAVFSFLKGSILNFKDYIYELPDFPAPGVLFRDMSPLLAEPQVFAAAIDRMLEKVNLNNIDYFVGIESRGFILASAMALRAQKGLIAVRKAGKLPPPVVQETYQLEYGTASIEMRKGEGRVALVDDVLATGGTLLASRSLCARAGYTVNDHVVLIDLKFLSASNSQLPTVHHLLQYE